MQFIKVFFWFFCFCNAVANNKRSNLIRQTQRTQFNCIDFSLKFKQSQAPHDNRYLIIYIFKANCDRCRMQV